MTGEPTRNDINDSSSLGFMELNPGYTFREFVTGAHNRYVTATARAVAGNPGKVYNPFIICGESGLGKTHLMQAIARRIRDSSPAVKILSINARKLAQDIEEAAGKGDIARVRGVCDSGDVFLLDDLQALPMRAGVQDAVCDILRGYYERRKQIVIVSTMPPDDLAGLSGALKKLLADGCVTVMKVPDLETRAAIMRKKVESSGITIDENIVLYAASKLKVIAEIEKVVGRIYAFASNTNQPVTMGLVYNLIVEMLPSENGEKIDYLFRPDRGGERSVTVRKPHEEKPAKPSLICNETELPDIVISAETAQPVPEAAAPVRGPAEQEVVAPESNKDDKLDTMKGLVDELVNKRFEGTLQKIEERMDLFVNELNALAGTMADGEGKKIDYEKLENKIADQFKAIREELSEDKNKGKDSFEQQVSEKITSAFDVLIMNSQSEEERKASMEKMWAAMEDMKRQLMEVSKVQDMRSEIEARYQEKMENKLQEIRRQLSQANSKQPEPADQQVSQMIERSFQELKKQFVDQQCSREADNRESLDRVRSALEDKTQKLMEEGQAAEKPRTAVTPDGVPAEPVTPVPAQPSVPEAPPIEGVGVPASCETAAPVRDTPKGQEPQQPEKRDLPAGEKLALNGMAVVFYAMQEAAQDTKVLNVGYFYPSGKSAEIERIKGMLKEAIKKHKLKYELQCAFDGEYETGAVGQAQLLEVCKKAGTNIVAILGPESSGEDVIKEVVDTIKDDIKFCVELIPWDKRGHNYMYVNLALDFTLFHCKT